MSYVDDVLSGKYGSKKKKKQTTSNTKNSSRSSFVDDVLSGNYTTSLSYKNNKDKDDEEIAPVKTTKKEEKHWTKQILQTSEAFKDGYQFGDVTKTIGGTIADLGMSFIKAPIGIGESIGTGLASGVAQVADWVGQDEYADKVRNKIATKEAPMGKLIREGKESVDNYSVSGNTGDAISEGAGYLASLWAGGQVGGAIGGALGKGATAVEKGTNIARTGLMFGSSAGSTFKESYSKEGVEDWQAWAKAIGSGYLTAKIEKLGGVFGTGSLDTKIANTISSKIMSGAGKIAARIGVTGFSEMAEEFLEYAGNQGLDLIIDKVNSTTSKNDATFKEEWDWDEVGQNMFLGFVLGSGAKGLQVSGDVSNNMKSNNMSLKDAINETAKAEDIKGRLEVLEDQKASLEEELESKKLTRTDIDEIFDEMQQVDTEIQNLRKPINTVPTNVNVQKPVQQKLELQEDTNAQQITDKTYYHGTRGDFESFDNSKIGQNYEGDWSSLGKGFYFTNDSDSAKKFGESSINEGEVTVKEAKLDIKKPFYVDDLTKNDKQTIDNIKAKYELGDIANGYNLIDALKKKGLDSTEVLKESGFDGIIAEDEVMVFDASQINLNKQQDAKIQEAPTQSIVENDNASFNAPTSQDIVEKQNQEAFKNITDNDMPTQKENTTPAETEQVKVDDPFKNRDIDEVGNRKVKAYQYENPEVKPYFQEEAQNMLHDLDNTVKGQKGMTQDELGNTEFYGTTRQTAEAIAYLKDNYGYSYEQIRKGLNDIIEGKDNNAVAKRIEFMLDERLRKGYITSDGVSIPANQDYINFLNEKQTTEHNREASNTLTDKDVPTEAKQIEEVIAPLQEKIETLTKQLEKIQVPIKEVSNIEQQNTTEQEIAPPVKETARNPFELTDEQDAKIQELRDDTKKWAEVYKERYDDKKFADKRIKGVAMQNAAEIRKVIQGDALIDIEGGLTSKELSALTNRLRSNYIGKKVSVDGKEGTIFGNAYGKIGVEFTDGTKQYVEKNLIKPLEDIDSIIQEQQRMYEQYKQEVAPEPQKQAVEQPIKKSKQRLKLEKRLSELQEQYNSGKLDSIQRHKLDFAMGEIEDQLRRMAYMENIVAPVVQEKLQQKQEIVPEATELSVEQPKTEVEEIVPPTEKIAQNENTEQIEDNTSVETELKDIKNTVKNNPNLSEEKLVELMDRVTELEKKRNKIQNPLEISKLTEKDADTTPELPMKKIKKGDKESSFYKNVTETSQMLSEETRQELAKDENIKFYKGVTNKESLTEAYKRLEKGGKAETLRWMKEDFKDATDIAEGWILLKQYQDKGDIQGAVEIAKKMRTGGTKAGQMTQAYNIMQRLTPEGMFMYAQKELSEAYEIMSKGKSKAWIDANKSKFDLTPQDTALIKNNMEAIQTMPDGYEKRVKLAEIQKIIQDKIPPERGQGIKAWMRISMLANPKTLMTRNPLGNLSVVPVNAVADMIASRVDKIISKKTNVRTTGNLDLKQYTKGFKKGIYESYSDFRKGINTRNMEGNRFEVNEGKSFNDNKLIGKALNKLDNAVSFALDAGDRGYYEGAFMNSIHNQMILNNSTEVTQEMIDIATTEALSRTWQDNNNYTKFVLNVREGLNKIGVKGYGLGDVLIPFAKTPANLTKAIVEYSPAGFINTLIDGKKLKNAIETDQFDAKMQHKFVQDLGKATAGTMLYVLGYALAQAGITGGESDEDKDARNFLKNTMGVNSYSIKIGDHTFTYDWMQPVAAPLSIMANVVKKQEEEATLQQAILSSLDTAGNLLVKQSFMESINTVISNNDGIATGLMEAIFELPSRAVPTLFKQITDMVDGTQRQTFVYDDPLKTMGNKVLNKIPFLSDNLAPTVDTLGRETQKYGGENNWFNVFFNPSNLNATNTTESGEEIYRLYQETGDKTIMPRQVPYYVNSDGKKIKLSNEERARFQTVAGTMADKNINALLSNEIYEYLSDEDKAEVVSNIVNYSYNIAQSEVVGTELSEQYESAKGFTDLGGKISDYYLFKNGIDDTDSDTKKETVVDGLLNMSATDQQKAYLYGKYYSSEDALNVVLDTGIPMDEFIVYNSQEFVADKNSDGKSISGSRKKKIYDYINSMNIDYEHKLILAKMEYKSEDRYNYEIIEYLNNDDSIDYFTMEFILSELGFKVDDDGNIKW